MVGKVIQECVSKGRCHPKSGPCKQHQFSIDYTPTGGQRVRMTIARAFGVLCMSKAEAETKWLGKFIEEVNAAQRAGRKPFEVVTQDITTVGQLLRAFVKESRQEGGDLALIEDVNLKHRCLIIDRDLGDWSLARVQNPTAMAAYKALKLKATKRNGETKSLATTNRLLAEIRTMLIWAKARKIISEVPFGRHLVSIETKAEVKRKRRLLDGEEKLLLQTAKLMDSPLYKHVGQRLHGCIIGALDTGLRQGEQMRAQVEDVIWRTRDDSALNVPFFKTVRGERIHNSKYEREIPIPITPRLYDIIEKKRQLGPKAFLFGDAAGRYIEKFVTSWNTLNLLAHGYTSNRSKHHGRSAADKAALETIALHWHDLRHEAISRWAEADGENGEPLFDVDLLKKLAGHTLLATTLRYIQQRKGRAQNQMAKFVKATQSELVGV